MKKVNELNYIFYGERRSTQVESPKGDEGTSADLGIK